MKPLMPNDPLSTYDILYKGMSDEDRNRLEKDLDTVLKTCADEAQKMLVEGVQKAVTSAYNHLYTNPWYDVIQANGGAAGGFIDSLVEHLWKSLLKSSPADMDKRLSWKMDLLVKAWRRDFPGEWEELCRELALKDFAKKTEQYDTIFK